MNSEREDPGPSCSHAYLRNGVPKPARKSVPSTEKSLLNKHKPKNSVRGDIDPAASCSYTYLKNGVLKPARKSVTSTRKKLLNEHKPKYSDPLAVGSVPSSSHTHVLNESIGVPTPAKKSVRNIAKSLFKEHKRKQSHPKPSKSKKKSNRRLAAEQNARLRLFHLNKIVADLKSRRAELKEFKRLLKIENLELDNLIAIELDRLVESSSSVDSEHNDDFDLDALISSELENMGVDLTQSEELDGNGIGNIYNVQTDHVQREDIVEAFLASLTSTKDTSKKGSLNIEEIFPENDSHTNVANNKREREDIPSSSNTCNRKLNENLKTVMQSQQICKDGVKAPPIFIDDLLDLDSGTNDEWGESFDFGNESAGVNNFCLNLLCGSFPNNSNKVKKHGQTLPGKNSEDEVTETINSTIKQSVTDKIDEQSSSRLHSLKILNDGDETADCLTSDSNSKETLSHEILNQRLFSRQPSEQDNDTGIKELKVNAPSNTDQQTCIISMSGKPRLDVSIKNCRQILPKVEEKEGLTCKKINTNSKRRAYNEHLNKSNVEQSYNTEKLTNRMISDVNDVCIPLGSSIGSTDTNSSIIRSLNSRSSDMLIEKFNSNLTLRMQQSQFQEGHSSSLTPACVIKTSLKTASKKSDSSKVVASTSVLSSTSNKVTTCHHKQLLLTNKLVKKSSSSSNSVVSFNENETKKLLTLINTFSESANKSLRLNALISVINVALYPNNIEDSGSENKDIYFFKQYDDLITSMKLSQLQLKNFYEFLSGLQEAKVLIQSNKNEAITASTDDRKVGILDKTTVQVPKLSVTDHTALLVSATNSVRNVSQVSNIGPTNYLPVNKTTNVKTYRKKRPHMLI